MEIKTYRVARIVLGIITVFGWIMVAFGVIAAIGGVVFGTQAETMMAQGGPEFAAMPAGFVAIPGMMLAVAGLFNIGAAQIGGAVLDMSIAAQRTARAVMGRGPVQAAPGE